MWIETRKRETNNSLTLGKLLIKKQYKDWNIISEQYGMSSRCTWRWSPVLEVTAEMLSSYTTVLW